MRRFVLALACGALLAGPAEAAPVELGIQDDPVLVRHPASFGGMGADRLIGWERAYEAMDALGVTAVRINVAWADVATRDGFDWGPLDGAVDRARAGGRRVQLTLTGPAPPWASGNGLKGYFRPDATAFATFAGAAARHFHGRVARYSIWNEPNWHSYLLPRRTAARQYRRIYRLAHAAVKAVDPAIEVLIGELAPMSRPEAAISPLRFLRGVTCSDRRWRAVKRCAGLQADGFAHHPYTLRWRPEFPGPGPDDVTTGSLDRLTSALDALARRRALATPGGRPLALFLTEWGFHGDSRRIPEPLRSRYVRRGLERIALHSRVRQVVWYQLAAPPRGGRRRIWDTALLDARGRRRPAFGAVREWVASRR